VARLLLNVGARGELVRRVQLRLVQGGGAPGKPDGDYGGGTAGAVRAFRRSKGLGAGDDVDVPTWRALVGPPLPTVRDRALQVTAAFEGHGFGLIEGNWDGAFLTWGVIGFTLKHGEVSTIVLETNRRHPELVRDVFGAHTDELLAAVRAPSTRQLAFANSISVAPKNVRVKEPWRSAFRRLGEFPEVQAIQLERVDARFAGAKQLARDLNLKTELGLALCFDIVVQNGTVKQAARARIARDTAAHPTHNERELRVIVAHAVADQSAPAFRDDVRSRKLTLATGAGRVHGETYVIRNWGLDDSPVSLA